jgi:hypothetical protein
MKARDVKHTSVESPCVRAMAVLTEGVPAMGWESRKPEAALPSRLMTQTCEEEPWGQFPAPAPFFDSDASITCGVAGASPSAKTRLPV